jgi:hypothetical protein
MFFLLVTVVALHQIYITLTNKQDKWPLRHLTSRLIEYFGRVFLFPFIISYYIIRIGSLPILFLLPMILIVSFIAIRESFGLIKVTQIALKDLIAKANHSESKVADFSRVEIIILNYLLFKTFSFQFQKISNILFSKGELNSQNILMTTRDLSPGVRDVEEIKERERLRQHSLCSVGGGEGGGGGGGGLAMIHLTSSRTQKRQLRNEIKRRRKLGRDSDDEDDDDDEVEEGGGGGGGGREDMERQQQLQAQYGRSYSNTTSSSNSIIVTSPVHRL